MAITDHALIRVRQKVHGMAARNGSELDPYEDPCKASIRHPDAKTYVGRTRQTERQPSDLSKLYSGFLLYEIM